MLPRYYEKYSSNQALFYNLINYSFFLKTFGNHSLIIDLFEKMENHFTKCIQGCTFVLQRTYSYWLVILFFDNFTIIPNYISFNFLRRIYKCSFNLNRKVFVNSKGCNLLRLITVWFKPNSFNIEV